MAITFVINAPLDASTRSKQLMDAEIRSHAARVAHQRSNSSSKQSQKRRPSCRRAQQVDQCTTMDTFRPRSKSHNVVISSNWAPTAALRRASAPIPQTLMIDENAVSADEDEDIETNVRSERDETPHKWLSSCQAQPSVVTLNLEMDSITRIFWQISATASSSFCALWNVRTMYSQGFLDLFADEAFAHMGKAFIKYEYGQLIDPHTDDADVLFHKTEALKIIRQRIEASGGVLDDVTMLAIMWLPFIDDLSSRSSQETSRMHWHTVFRIFHTARVRSKLLEDEQMSVFFEDALTQIRAFAGFHVGKNFAALENQERPTGSPPGDCGDPQNYPTSITSRLPVGITTLLNIGVVGATTLTTSQRILDLTTTDPDGRTYISLPKILSTQHAATSSFIDTWHLREAKTSTIPGEPSIEEILPMTMLTYSARFSGPLGFVNSTSRAARSDCTVKLSYFLAQRSEAEEHAIFWIYAVTVESWRTRTGELHCEGRNLRATMADRFPWSTNEALALPILKKFFFNDELLRNYAQLPKAELCIKPLPKSLVPVKLEEVR